MTWNDRERRLVLEPGGPEGAVNLLPGGRTFRVELLPGGEIRTVQYSGTRVEVRF